MCDTILAAPESTAAGAMLFGKNSDRQRNEAQIVESLPRASHPPEAELTCTYITIPQVRQTHAVLICRPFWIWGAEMGVNEHGVVIGNEGLRGRSPVQEQPALIGMDLLRLALERANTAAEAVEVITTLLERHGQGGNCGHLTPAYYNNGFMIADAKQAFVLETMAREWLVERVRGVHAISNAYSIGHGAHSSSSGLGALIRALGWMPGTEPNYAEFMSDKQIQHIGSAEARRQCSMSLLSSRKGELRATDMMNILRDHGSGDGPHLEWREEYASRRTLCLHANAGDNSGQTVGSMVSEVRDKNSVHWVTGTSAPCISIFKPVLMDVPLPSHGPQPSDRFDPRALWWRHERLHRAAVQGDFARILDEIRPERDALEAELHTRIESVLSGGSAADRSWVVSECWSKAMQLEDLWHARYGRWPVRVATSHGAAWRKMNQLARME